MAKTIKIPAGEFCSDCKCLKMIDILATTSTKRFVPAPHCSYYNTFLPMRNGNVLKDIHCPETELEVTIYGDNEY